MSESPLSISSPGVHFGDDAAARGLARRVDDFAAQVCAEHPDRFDFSAALPLPDVPGALAGLARALDDLGAVGVAVAANAHGRYLGDPAFEPVWAELDRRAARVFVHTTSPPGWERTALGAPQPVVGLFSSTRTVDLVLRGLWYDLAGTPVPTQVPLLVGALGSDHLLCGSDHCSTPAAGVGAQVAALDAVWGPGAPVDWRALAARSAGELFPW